MDKIRRHLQERIATLKDDVEFWKTKSYAAVDETDRLYCESRITAKQDVIYELSWALTMCED